MIAGSLLYVGWRRAGFTVAGWGSLLLAAAGWATAVMLGADRVAASGEVVEVEHDDRDRIRLVLRCPGQGVCDPVRQRVHLLVTDDGAFEDRTGATWIFAG